MWKEGERVGREKERREVTRCTRSATPNSSSSLDTESGLCYELEIKHQYFICCVSTCGKFCDISVWNKLQLRLD